MYVLTTAGGQFGDEGKGKITDMLAEHADIVARSCGSHDADHTISKSGTKHSLHILPSGVFYKNALNVIGAGVLVDPVLLLEELKALQSHSIFPNLGISPHARLIMEWHIAFEHKTGYGAYTCAQTPREAVIRAKDLLSPKLSEKIRQSAGLLLAWLVESHPRFEKFRKLPMDELHSDAELSEELDVYAAEIAEKYEDTADELQEYIHDAELDCNFLLGEGVQGTMVDPLHGTFPDVVPTHPIAGGFCTGLGMGPTAVDDVLGFFKAYETRIGEGLFPTELRDETGECLRKHGAEFTTTDGRPRRCGWFNLEQAQNAARLNGMTWMAVTKLDVLDQLAAVKVFTGKLYKEFKGWESPTTGCRSWEELPEEAKVFLEYIQKELCPMAFVSVGPAREQTIVMPEFAEHLAAKGISMSLQ